MAVCDRASGLRQRMGPPTDYFFPAPAVAASGRLVVLGDISENVSRGVIPYRMSANGLVRQNGAPLLAGTSGRAKLITVKLKPDGAYAWMTCRIVGPLAPYLRTGEHARCDRPGVAIYVYTHNAADDDDTSRRVGQGSTIDPRTFRLRGSTISWRQHGRTREASLR
jgi:hypothetical protein